MTSEPERESAEATSLRSLMGKLEPVKAPWYLEARLRQSIAAMRDKPKRVLRPLVAVPVTAVAAAILLYVSFRGSEDRPALPDGIILPGIPPEQINGNGHDPLENEGARKREEAVPSAVERDFQRGPSDSQDGGERAATLRRQAMPTGRSAPSQPAALRPAGFAADSVPHLEAVQDSSDTLDVTPDSLRPRRRE